MDDLSIVRLALRERSFRTAGNEDQTDTFREIYSRYSRLGRAWYVNNADIRSCAMTGRNSKLQHLNSKSRCRTAITNPD